MALVLSAHVLQVNMNPGSYVGVPPNDVAPEKSGHDASRIDTEG
jgi:hypothetical protein